jgi:Carboxypeptidase regulatory-like domain/TonB dependent receptor/TonB-dependent Receptor Plug Domain
MQPYFQKPLIAVFVIIFFFVMCVSAHAQSAGNSTSVVGTVADPSGAVVLNATVEIHNPVSGFVRTVTTDAAGRFSIPNVPFNSYHLQVTAQGFAAYTRDIDVHSVVPVSVSVGLKLENSETVTVESAGEDLLEKTSSFHTDVDNSLIDKLPLESSSSAVSSLVTLASPGISADSNGLFHGLGDHAENSFSVDGQPITDQQSKVFSNQIPLESIQSLEVLSGAPSAEYGDKTSVVINVTTRSGQGMTTPHGSVTASFGSFGTANTVFTLGFGGKNWGNFISASGLNSGRFLDPPEFKVMHAKGNEENLFDRVDYQISTGDSIHVNLGYTRSWFQDPNSYDNLHIGQVDPFGRPSPATDQRSQIKTFNIAPSWTRLVSNTSVFTLGAFVRRDDYNYYPSGNPLADLSPIQQETVGQHRTLANAGLRSDYSYVKGVHSLKVGAVYQQTFLTEDDSLGIVDPLLNAPCIDSGGNAVEGFNDPSQCAGAGYQPNTALNPVATQPFVPLLGCYDLTRPSPSAADNCASLNSALFPFHGHTDVKELALYAQDTITKGPWSFNLGLRGDFYNGLARHREAEPRVGMAYNIKPTNTVLRVSYARVMETPFNENLVLSANGCNSTVIADLVPCVPAAFNPGLRNEFHAGLQQAFGKYLVFSGEYIWKYTHNAYDFSVLGNTPIFFPIEWHNSKIPGFAARLSVPNFHGFSAQTVFSSVAARFLPPQVGGLGVTVGQSGLPFRIDHDEKFNQTTHLQYQPWKRGPWLGFNWRYDSGLVAGAVPFATDTTTPVDLTGLSADQQLQAGLFCGSQFPTLSSPLTSCAPSQLGSTLVSIPAPGTENDDKNPPRIAPRHLFDLAIGDDNLFHGDKKRWSAQFTVINLTNKVAPYNFLSTFSGTHYVSPRTVTAQVGFNF